MFYYMFDVTKNKERYEDYGAVAVPDSGDGDDHSSSISSLPSGSTDPTSSRRRILSIDDAVNAIGSSTNHLCARRLFIGTALLFLVDSMELSILAYLSQALDKRVQGFHHLQRYVAYAGVGGALAGALVWGSLGDVVGRQRVTVWVSGMVTVFSIVTALLMGWATRQKETTSSGSNDNNDNVALVVQGLLLSRFLVGFGLGGITVPYDWLAEWLARPQRGPVLLLVHVFWSIGSLLIFALLQTNTALSPQEGQLSGIELYWCTLPAILATVVLVLDNGDATILESPRFLLAHGRHDEALEVLRSAATTNRGNDDLVHQLFPESMTVILYSKESHIPLRTTRVSPRRSGPSWNGIRDLLSLKWMRLAWALLFTYFGQAFCYRGTAEMLISVFDEDHHEQKYQAGFSAVFELVGICLLIIMVDPWGRVTTQIAAYALASLSCLTLAVWYTLPFLENGNVLICLSFITRMLVFGGGAVTWVSTTELLSTEIRTTGHAIGGMAQRLGAFAATLFFPGIDDIPLLALIVFAVSFWVAFAAGDIPETRMKEMGRSYVLLGHSERWNRDSS